MRFSLSAAQQAGGLRRRGASRHAELIKQDQVRDSGGAVIARTPRCPPFTVMSGDVLPSSPLEAKSLLIIEEIPDGFLPASLIFSSLWECLPPVCTPCCLYSNNLRLHLFLPGSWYMIRCTVAASCSMCHVSFPTWLLRSAVAPRLSGHFTCMNHVKCMCASLGRSRAGPRTSHRILQNTHDSHEHLLQMDAFDLLHFEKSPCLCLKSINLDLPFSSVNLRLR